MKAAKRSGVSLEDALRKSVAASGTTAPAPTAAAPAPAEEAPAPASVKIECYITEDDRDRLNKLKVDVKMSLQQIQHQAVSQWLTAHGHAPLTPQTANRPSGRKR